MTQSNTHVLDYRIHVQMILNYFKCRHQWI